MNRSIEEEEPQEEVRKLFLAGLPSEFNTENLEQSVSALCNSHPIKVNLSLRRNKKNCLGTAVIETTPAIAHVLLQKKYFFFARRKIKILLFREGDDLQKFKAELSQRKLYIKNLPKDIEPHKMERFLKGYGEVESVYVRGEPCRKTKIIVAIFYSKIPARRFYQSYRYGRINFERIFGRKLSQNVLVGSNLQELKDYERESFVRLKGSKKGKRGRRSSRVGRRSNNITCFRKNLRGLERSFRPGHSKFDYETDAMREYCVNLPKRRRGVMRMIGCRF